MKSIYTTTSLKQKKLLQVYFYFSPINWEFLARNKTSRWNYKEVNLSFLRRVMWRCVSKRHKVKNESAVSRVSHITFDVLWLSVCFESQELSWSFVNHVTEPERYDIIHSADGVEYTKEKAKNQFFFEIILPVMNDLRCQSKNLLSISKVPSSSHSRSIAFLR